MKKKYYILISILIFILLLIVSFFIYVGNYYHADLEDISVFSSDGTYKEVLDDNTIVYSSKDASTGIIFYPGGKVDHLAYEPLVMECAKYGYLCAIVDMPFNLAVFDIDKANSVLIEYPEIDTWYIGGHSLGGAMAATYVSDNVDIFSGLILLGSYSSVDLSKTSLEVISIYGSEDKVLNMEKYTKNKKNLPHSFVEKVISGGCHSNFGMYGLQSGDGKCLISSVDQIRETMFLIYKYIG